jgi:hypothetical protein
VYFKDLGPTKKGQLLNDVIKDTAGSVVWGADNSVVSRRPPPHTPSLHTSSLYHHHVSSPRIPSLGRSRTALGWLILVTPPDFLFRALNKHLMRGSVVWGADNSVVSCRPPPYTPWLGQLGTAPGGWAGVSPEFLVPPSKILSRSELLVAP